MAAESTEAGSTNSLLRELHAQRNKRLQGDAAPLQSDAADHAPATVVRPDSATHTTNTVDPSRQSDGSHGGSRPSQSDEFDQNPSHTAKESHDGPVPISGSSAGRLPQETSSQCQQAPSQGLGSLDQSKLATIRGELDCPLCMAMFCDPLTLQCGHSFCRSCLSRSAQVGGAAACPMCRTPMLLDTQDINTSYTLSSIMHTLFPAECAARAAEASAEAAEASTRALPVFYLDTPYMPRQKVQLLVFELRYLELVNRAMAGGRTFCVFKGGDIRAAQGAGGEPAIGAAVRIDSTEQLPGGRLQLTGTVTTLLECSALPQLVPGGSGLELLPVQDRTDRAPGDDDFNQLLQPLVPSAAGQTAHENMAHVPSTQMVQEYRDVLHACAADLVAQLGPLNASAMAAAYGTLPSTAVQLSHYLTAALDLHPNVVARCRRTRSTLQRLAEAYAFLAEHAQPEHDTGAVDGAPHTPHVPPLGRVHAPSVLRFCRGGDAWLRSMGQAIAKPTPVQGVVVLLAVLLLLYFNSA